MPRSRSPMTSPSRTTAGRTTFTSSWLSSSVTSMLDSVVRKSFARMFSSSRATRTCRWSSTARSRHTSMATSLCGRRRRSCTTCIGALQPVTSDIPAYRFEACRVFTSQPPCGPKRGHGTPQPRFALELHLEKIAHDIGLDPVELKQRNFVKPNTLTVNWLRVTSCGLDECTERVIKASRFHDRKTRVGRGMGFAISSYLHGAGTAIYWNDMPHSEVQIKVDRGGVTAYCGAMDIGQGSDSVLATIIAEELGLQPADVRLATADTDTTPTDLGSSSSRVTFMGGNAALEAARKMRTMLAGAVAAKASGDASEGEFSGGRIGGFGFEAA